MARPSKKQSVYLPPEMVPYVLCGAALNLAMERNAVARRLYEQVKADLTLKVSQKLFSPLEHNNVGLAKRLAKEAGYGYKKGPPPGNQMIVIRGLLKGSQRSSRGMLGGSGSWQL